MSQLWTIVDLASGEVLCPAFETAGPYNHPKDAGWAWVSGGQKAFQIDAVPQIPFVLWDGSGWIADVDQLRAQRWEAIKARGQQAEEAGCNTPLGRVDTKGDSQQRIAAAAQVAMIAKIGGAPFAVGWTMADNSTVVHDADAMIAAGVAAAQYVWGCHAIAVARRAMLDAAATLEEIEAVPVDTGWPS